MRPKGPSSPFRPRRVSPPCNRSGPTTNAAMLINSLGDSRAQSRSGDHQHWEIVPAAAVPKYLVQVGPGDSHA